MSVLVKGSVAGVECTMRMPTLDELDAIKDSDALFKKCVVEPSGDELKAALVKKPGIPLSMGVALLKATGAVGPLEELEEHEFTDDVAEAFVKFEDVGTLHAVRYTSKATGYSVTVVAREPNGTELKRLEKKSGHKASREFARLAIVYPVGEDKKFDCADADARAPGFYSALSNLLVSRSGVSAEVELGEA